MGKQWFQFLGFSFVLMAIILCSIVFGGYSSLHRSEGRIDITKELLFKACQSRLDLLPKLLNYVQESEQKKMLAKLKQTGKDASSALHYAVAQKTPMDNALTLKLEASQHNLTKEIVTIFLRLDQSESKQAIESFKSTKNGFFSAQNELSLAKIKYNTEVRYFNRRTKIFPGYLIAKIFGFDKSEYFALSAGSFLEAARTFSVQ
jgi:LemA protein